MRLKRLQNTLGQRVKYYGYIDGDEKKAFFNNIDIFIFPTRYWRESQPNVIYEAMSSGAIVIATRWACIPYMMDNAPHYLVEPSSREVMAQQTVDAILSEASNVHRLLLRKYEVLKEFKRIQCNAEIAYHQFLYDLSGIPTDKCKE